MYIKIELWNDDNEVEDNYTRLVQDETIAKDIYEEVEALLVEL